MTTVRILTSAEVTILRGCTDHTALHAHALLLAHPTLRLTGGRRTAERNRAVGGVKNSAHLIGRGVDFGGPEALLQAAAKTAKAQRVTAACTGPEQVLIHDAGSGRHLHVGW